MKAVRQRAVMDVMVVGECIPFAELVARLPQYNRQAVSAGATGLVVKGYLRRVERGCYELTRDGVAAKESGKQMTHEPLPEGRPSRDNSLRARAWRVLRSCPKGVTHQEVVTLATTGREKAALPNIQTYLRALRRAGYLRVLPNRVDSGRVRGSGGFMVHRLVRNSGPQAPIIKDSRSVVFDPNNGLEWPIQGGE